MHPIYNLILITCIGIIIHCGNHGISKKEKRKYPLEVCAFGATTCSDAYERCRQRPVGTSECSIQYDTCMKQVFICFLDDYKE